MPEASRLTAAAADAVLTTSREAPDGSGLCMSLLMQSWLPDAGDVVRGVSTRIDWRPVVRGDEEPLDGRVRLFDIRGAGWLMRRSAGQLAEH